MKNIYLTLLITLTFNYAFAAPVIGATTSGDWDSPSTWDLNRVPASGDTIVIKAGKTVVVSTSHNFGASVYLKVYGTIDFQTNASTLNLSVGSTVLVFTGGKIQGTSNSQKIRIGGNQVYKGNDAPIVGPQMATNSTSSFVSFVDNVLPVKFITFTVIYKNNTALVQWTTSEEINAYSYEVERSMDGKDWKVIAYVAAIGNNKALNNYTFTDKAAATKISYYRIKQIDADGKFTYTNIRSLQTVVDANNMVNIVASEGKVVLQFAKEIKGKVMVRFVSVNGQIIDQQTIVDPIGQVVLTSKPLLKGYFVIALSTEQNISMARQVVL